MVSPELCPRNSELVSPELGRIGYGVPGTKAELDMVSPELIEKPFTRSDPIDEALTGCWKPFAKPGLHPVCSTALSPRTAVCVQDPNELLTHGRLAPRAGCPTWPAHNTQPSIAPFFP